MADSFAKISSMIESARDITIEAAVSASTRLTETPTAKRPQEIAKLLSSRLDREVLNGMKCVIALISNGEDGSVYFADVVKNITSTNARVRALVMIYVEKYAEIEPDTALLSINSVQKCLSDKTPNVRSASIRTLGGIRIPEIASLLTLCIKRTLSDRSPEVRSATALAIGSAYSIDGIDRSQLFNHLTKLMSDASPLVVGASVKVFVKLQRQLSKLSASKMWAPLHANYRRYVRMLGDLDEWTRCILTDLLVEYCRRFVPRPTLILPDETVIELPEDLGKLPSDYKYEMDSDVEVFVDALTMASFSASNMVVLSAIRALLSVATPLHVAESGFPKLLIKILTAASTEPEKLNVLQLILTLATTIPQVYQDHARKFFLHPRDSTPVASLKLQILSTLFTEESAKLIIKELQYNATSFRKEIAQNAVRAIGNCCQKSSVWSDKILNWCLSEMEKNSASLISADLLKVVRFLLQRNQSSASDSEQVIKSIYRLSLVLRSNPVETNEEAKASIIWTIGEFTQLTENLIGPDVLRQSLKTYSQEPEKVRFELLLLAAKSRSFEMQRLSESGEDSTPSIIQKMFEQVMHLARYDASTSTRDKARMLDELFRDESNHPLAYLFMQTPKAPPQQDAHSFSTTVFNRYMSKPRWADQTKLPPSSIRKESEELHSSSAGYKNNFFAGNQGISNASPTLSHARGATEVAKPGANRLQSLDEFFGDEEESEDGSMEESDSDEASLSESDEESEVDESDSDSDSDSDSVDSTNDK